MSDVHIDSTTFRRRLHAIQKNIQSSEYFQGVNGVLVVVGSSDDSNPYRKSTILHTWLLGYEFPATIFLITSKKITVLTSIGKAKYLNPLKSIPNLNLNILTRTKDSEHNLNLFNEFINELQTELDGKKLGYLPKDKYSGKFIDEWTPIWNDFKSKIDSKELDIDLLDISIGLSTVLEVKDEDEQKNLRIASRASTNMMTYFTDEMSKIIDEELNVTNLNLSEKIENKIDDSKFFQKMESNKSMKKLGADFDLNTLDWCYKPIVQSNGNFELKFSVESTDKKLGGSVILSSLGLRYKSYCSNISRTFLIGPSKEMEKNYDFLLQVQNKIFSLLKDGCIMKDAYNKTLEFIKDSRPDLANNFVKNLGSLIGIDFRDSTGVLNSKNERKINENSVIDLVIGFQNLKDDKEGDYALMLADTIRITGGEPIILTDSPKTRKEIAFYFEDDENDENDKQIKDEDEDEDEIKSSSKSKLKSKPKSKSSSDSSSSASSNDVKSAKSQKDSKPKKEPTSNIVTSGGANSRVLKAKLRAEQRQSEDDNSQIQKEIQKELHSKRQKEGLERFNPEDAQDGSEKRVVFKKYESYIRDTQIPNNVRDLKIHIDSKNQTIILPICGRPVPFHINAYKNGSKSEEGEYTHLRLNFNSPGSIAGSRREELPYESGNDKQFIRSLTFRSKDSERMAEVLKKITELKKESIKRELDKREKADIVTQDSLIQSNRPLKLSDVYIRPSPETKRLPGTIAIHQNGIRYSSLGRSDAKVDIIYSNIKHLFFQSCKGELLVIIHCHLKTPIMIGKKKTFDVQFYREASDITVDETGNRKRKYRYGDEDELEQEQEERRRKAALDKEFKQFGEHIADASNGLVDLDIPFKELGFQGVPSRSAVLCMPTRDCLIQLLDLPFMVITLEEIEVAHLERVQFGLKNFDLVFVFKDFAKPVVHISTIPMENLEDVKAWLTDVDIPFSEGAVNLNWNTIMKTIQADPYQFFVDGGWSFLGDGGDDDGSGSEEEEESEFEVSDENPSDEDVASEEEYSEEGSGSDFDEDDDDDDVVGSDDEPSEDFSD
ncbi:hypothetical protein B5S30_g3789 [[Candida] boidinii]|nr:hypothetical protein B5S30_g3789 [[Candida] boidinii]